MQNERNKRTSIKTSRTQERGQLAIDEKKCIRCGACVQVCKDNSLLIVDGKLRENPQPVFGCFACGQCVAVCPREAISVTGRTVSPADFVPIPDAHSRASYEQLYNLLLSRRSVRDFADKTVEQDKIDAIVRLASTAPMGIPPSDVSVLILRGKEKVRQFSFDFLDYVKTMRWFFHPLFLAMLRPFVAKEEHEMLRGFIVPLIEGLLQERAKGKDWLLYDAPVAIYFYSSSYGDPADAQIAATYAMLAAESLGLGSCMIGSVAPVLKQRGGRAFKNKYGIPEGSAQGGMMVIFGYPKYHYRKALQRTFAKVF